MFESLILLKKREDSINNREISHDSSEDPMQRERNETKEIRGNDDNSNSKNERFVDRRATRKVLYNYSTHKGFILTFDFSDGLLITLGSDEKLCVWKDGQCLGVAANIPGTFIVGYPYIVKKSSKYWNQIYYTADDGIFMIEF